MNWFYRFLLWLGTKLYPLRVHGAENIPDGAAVIPYNHFSVFDPFYIRYVYKGEMYFLAKIELFKNKLFGSVLKAYGAIPVDRANPGIKSLLAAIKPLKQGKKLAISPEGTRNKTGSLEMLPFKDGTVMFAVKGKAQIVPCIVSRRAKLFRTTHMMFGKPFDFSEYYDKKLTDEDFAAMNEVLVCKMKETQKELLDLVSNLKKKKVKRGKKADKVKESV